MIELDFEAQAGGFALRAQARARTPGIIGVFGPSGAGKTTLLRAIAGFQKLHSGSIRIEGGEISGPPELRRIATVFQDSRLFPHLNVRENLSYGLKRAPEPHALALEAVACSLGVAALLDRRVRGLSGGEQKRIALGRALLMQPRLILMDEPLAGVDEARKTEIVDLIRTARARFNVAILLVSHDLDEVAALADDVLLLRDGAIVRAGSAQEVFADPESPLAARPDARVLIDGIVAENDEAHGIVTVAAGAARLVCPWFPAVPGEAVRLQIFARDVSLASAAPETISTQNVLPARVLSMRVRADKLALAALDTPAGGLLATVTQPAAARLALAPGAAVFALVKASAFAPRGET